MIIEKRRGNTVELEYEIRSLVGNEPVDLNLYDLSAKLSDGIGGVVVLPLTVTKLAGADKMGRCVVSLTSAQSSGLFPSTYDINVDYVEKATLFSESMQTVYLKLVGL